MIHISRRGFPSPVRFLPPRSLRAPWLAGPLVAPVLLLAAVVAASAQQGHSVTGTVTAGSDTGVQSPVAAATVQVKGMGIETVTDAQGRFTITAPTPNDTLVVTSIGYATS